MEKIEAEYRCEKCGKVFKAPYNKWCQMTHCECGGRAFDINGNTRVSPMTKL